ncbi:MAG: SpoIIE family protein phosphatase [Oscillospiraceae bacterium]|nr:SpoIIE family protein phosphatase [Oscillospiraceae bacterium]
MENSNVKGRTAKRRKEFLDRGLVVLRAPILLRAAEYGIRFFIGAVLSAGEILNGCAPFGLGFVGASGAGLGGLFALFGVCTGYLLSVGFLSALKYVAASVLIFSVSFAFYDVRIYRSGWFIPLMTGLLTAATGFVYLPQEGATTASLILFLTEVLLAGASAYFFRVAFSPWTQKQEETELSHRQFVSLLILGMCLLITLSKVMLPGEISLGRLIAAFGVMAVAYKGGFGKGSAVGVGIGLSMDLAAGNPPFYTMAYGFSGLMTGIFAKQGRLFATVTYVLSNALAVLWAYKQGASISILYEVFIASVLFCLIPERRLQRFSGLVQEGRMGDGGERVRIYVQERLESTAAAFHELYESLRSSFAAGKSNDNDIATVFDRAANRVCRSCPLWNSCWQRDYVNTFNALNDVSAVMQERGRAEAEDFPRHFSGRCLRFSRFLAASNEELTALLCRKQFHNRLLESRMTVCRQYADLAGILGGAAAELGTELQVDAQHSKRIAQHLQGLGVEAETTVFHDEKGHLRVELEGKDLSPLKAEDAWGKFTDFLGVPLREPQRKTGKDTERMIFCEAEPLVAVMGIAARRKEGESVSGDSGTYFKTDSGTLYVVLADGMGCGDAAARESGLAIRLLERFLQAEVDPEPAMKTLNSALVLRSEAEGGFTTIDLLEVNLFTGQAGLYKYGAAPTYFRKGNRVSRTTGSAMPAGLAAGGAPAPDMTKVHMEPGDLTVLISDGILAGGEDGWLRAAIASHTSGSPRDLARSIIEESETRAGSGDDKTVMVLTVEPRR